MLAVCCQWKVSYRERPRSKDVAFHGVVNTGAAVLAQASIPECLSVHSGFRFDP